MDRTFTRRFTTALAGPTLAVGVLVGTLVVATPAAADTMGLSMTAPDFAAALIPVTL